MQRKRPIDDMESEADGIVEDGRKRLLDAIAAEVARKYQDMLAATADPLERAAIKERIDRETKECQAHMPAHALWSIK